MAVLETSKAPRSGLAQGGGFRASEGAKQKEESYFSKLGNRTKKKKKLGGFRQCTADEVVAMLCW